MWEGARRAVIRGSSTGRGPRRPRRAASRGRKSSLHREDRAHLAEAPGDGAIETFADPTARDPPEQDAPPALQDAGMFDIDEAGSLRRLDDEGDRNDPVSS